MARALLQLSPTQPTVAASPGESGRETAPPTPPVTATVTAPPPAAPAAPRPSLTPTSTPAASHQEPVATIDPIAVVASVDSQHVELVEPETMPTSRQSSLQNSPVNWIQPEEPTEPATTSMTRQSSQLRRRIATAIQLRQRRRNKSKWQRLFPTRPQPSQSIAMGHPPTLTVGQRKMFHRCAKRSASSDSGRTNSEDGRRRT